MNEILMLTSIFIGSFTVTSYRSVPSQTDDSPFITSIGERVGEHGCAASQDLLKRGIVSYGDLLYVEDIGFKIVNDTMNIRIRNHLDIWVPTLEKEKQHHSKFKNRKLRVWLIKRSLV